MTHSSFSSIGRSFIQSFPRLLARLAVLVFAVSLPSYAQEVADKGVYAKVGNQGYGLGMAFPINPSVTARLGGDFFNLDRSVKGSDGFSADASMKLQNFGAYADWYPFSSSGFRATAGLQVGTIEATLKVKPEKTDGSKQEFLVDGTTFTINDANAGIAGTADLGKIAPYLGIGYQSRNKGLSLNFDLGLRFSKVSASIKAEGLNGPVCKGDTGACVETSRDARAELQTKLDAESRKLEDDLKVLKTYPVISLGLVYNW